MLIFFFSSNGLSQFFSFFNIKLKYSHSGMSGHLFVFRGFTKREHLNRQTRLFHKNYVFEKGRPRVPTISRQIRLIPTKSQTGIGHKLGYKGTNSRLFSRLPILHSIPHPIPDKSTLPKRSVDVRRASGVCGVCEHSEPLRGRAAPSTGPEVSVAALYTQLPRE